MAEIISCPSCQRKLQIPEEYFGKTVQCPECKHSFTAGAGGTTGPAAPSRPPEWEKPTSRPGAYDEDEEDDRPRRRRRRFEDDEDDYDEIEQRRRRRYMAPHRGAMILTLGILGFFVCGLIFGPMAWIMGNTDLNEMRSGRMDPEGEGMTQAGRIIGIIVTLLTVAVLVFYCFVVAIIGVGGGGRRF